MKKIGFLFYEDALDYIESNYPDYHRASTSCDSESVSWSRRFNCEIDSYSGEVAAYLLTKDDDMVIVAWWN